MTAAEPEGDDRAPRLAAASAKASRHGVAMPRGQTPMSGARSGRFGRMFAYLPARDPGPAAIAALVELTRKVTSEDNPAIAAGYTYLGQFIDHDITFDPTSQLQRDNEPPALVNFRSPRFDLDTLYGTGPKDQPFMYEWCCLADRGVKVFACGRRAERLESLADLHDGIIAVEVDVRYEDDRARLVDTAGPVDMLVNCAGVAYLGLVEEMSAGELAKMLETNCLGYFDLARRVLPGMLERRSGHILDVGSSSVWLPGPPLTAYAATKAAVHAFNVGLRRETMGRGVHVSVVAPGPVATEITSASGHGTIGPFLGVFDALAGQPEPVADAVVDTLGRSGWTVPTVRSVPRAVGLLRILEAPGVDRLTDVGVSLWREVMRRTSSLAGSGPSVALRPRAEAPPEGTPASAVGS